MAILLSSMLSRKKNGLAVAQGDIETSDAALPGFLPAIVFLVAIYCSSITGGSITAILFKIPGVPSSAPTTSSTVPWTFST